MERLKEGVRAKYEQKRKSIRKRGATKLQEMVKTWREEAGVYWTIKGPTAISQITRSWPGFIEGISFLSLVKCVKKHLLAHKGSNN